MRLLKRAVAPEALARDGEDDRSHPAAPLRRRGLAEPELPFLVADGGHARARGPQTADALVPPRLRAAAGDARGGAHGTARAAAAAQSTAELIGAITGFPVLHEVEVAPPPRATAVAG